MKYDLVAPLTSKEQKQTYHNWFLINGGRLENLQGYGFWPNSTNHAKYYPKLMY